MSSYVFISYSRKNAEVAHRIVSEIEGKGQAAYIDTRDIGVLPVKRTMKNNK